MQAHPCRDGAEATDADEDELKRILKAAADADFRIDAFSESLRQI
jgi:hypothetical protein